MHADKIHSPLQRDVNDVLQSMRFLSTADGETFSIAKKTYEMIV